MSSLLHLAERRYWDEARSTGVYRRSTRGASLDDVGFVHASTGSQMAAVADAVYADMAAEDLVLLLVDETVLARRSVPVRWESPDGGQERFPHLYGPIPASAVVAALPVTTDSSGNLCLPDLCAWDVRARPPA